MNSLRFRQVHLDFHTSPHIPGIGEKFDKKHFQKPRKITVNGKTFSASRWTYNVDKKFVSINVSEDINKEKEISICLK